mmetsp:Transcript_7624/g.22355  ORF Transcript_7624/g.22355 Transcript_7624/m.22355 type:complete len:135 (+) Transcript_7624:85-489(+)
MGHELSHHMPPCQEPAPGQPLMQPFGGGAAALIQMGPLGVRGAVSGSSTHSHSRPTSESPQVGPYSHGDEAFMGGLPVISLRPGIAHMSTHRIGGSAAMKVPETGASEDNCAVAVRTVDADQVFISTRIDLRAI